MGVQVGTPIQISGVGVGSVAARDLGVDDRRVRLTFTLEREVPLPKNTRAILATTSLLGDMAIIFDYDRPCQGSDCAEDGDTFEGITRGLMESVLGGEGMAPYMEQIKDGVKEIVDSLNKSLLSEDAKGPLAESARDMRSSMANIKAATGRMNTMLQRTSPSLEKSIDNMAALTTTLEKQKANIASILANVDSLSQQMVDARLDEAVNDAKATIKELDATLATAKSAMTGVDELVNQIQAGEGTLGMLIQDDQLYTNLNALSYSLDSLMIDIQEKPYRYVPLKSRRRVEKYDRKDATQQDN
jgi:phospholipid/cholesterol/gamma-HCH transport system substrate-binding protein